jgi:hypothetical protein
MQGGRFMLEHSGEVPGFTAENMVFPEDSAAIVVRGMIDRLLFTSNANAYFSDQALKDFQSSLGPLGTPTAFAQTRTSLRGGMTYRSYRVTFPSRVLRVWTYEVLDGKLEQYQVAPTG